MRSMMAPYARTRRISGSSRMRIKERLADGGAAGEMWFNAATQRAQRKRRVQCHGRMPPRMGAWQPERLRYGGATKNQRVAGGAQRKTRWTEGAGFTRCPRWRTEGAENAEDNSVRASLGCTRRSLMPPTSRPR